METINGLLDHVSKLDRDDQTISRLTILLSIIEPLLVNDLNLETSLNTPRSVKNLVDLLDITTLSKRSLK